MGIYKEKDEGHINVQDFGAFGDGSHDDTAAINDAWSAIPINGKLFFPEGTYKVSSNLVFSVTGSSPRGCYIEGVPGASIIMPTAAVTTAITLATESNSDGYCNGLKISGIRIDGVNTSGATGILVGENAGDLSAGIVGEDLQILRFTGSGSKGLNIRNVVNARFTRGYVSRCGTNLYIKGDDAGNDLPTTLLFENCQFREADTASSGTGRGADIVRCFRTSFRHCLFEANEAEGVYCVPGSGTDIVLWTEFDECWFEDNQATSPSSGYDIYADGSSADTVMIRLANVNFNSACPSIYFQSVFNGILDNVYPRASANSVVIGNNCQGSILNWPQNNVVYATAVSNSSPTTFGAQFHAPATVWDTFKSVGAATFLAPTNHADAITGLQGVNLNLLLQPGSSSSGSGILRDYQGNNVAVWNQNRLSMERRLAFSGDTVTAANDLTLPVTGNVFVITGNTQINAITTANWGLGPVILKFAGTPTVKHNTAGGAGTSPILLAGSVDLVAANNTTLTLFYDGANWQELARKAP